MKEIIRKKIDQIGMPDLVLYKHKDIYYVTDIYGTIRRASSQIKILLDKDKDKL